MALLKLKLKKLSPELELLYKIRPPVRVKKLKLLLLDDPKQFHRQVRRIKILQYAARQEKRTAEEKAADFEEMDEYQERWVAARMKGNARSWEVWDK